MLAQLTLINQFFQCPSTVNNVIKTAVQESSPIKPVIFPSHVRVLNHISKLFF